MAINETLKKIRKERGLKAVYVAEKVGLSANLLSAIECGRSGLTVPQFIKFADFYGVSLDYLAGKKPNHDV